jgi:TrmH family RNA methyltransferase
VTAVGGPQLITSASNALVKDLRQLAQESTAYRKLGRIWLEGDHLCEAALRRGVKPQLAVFSQSLWDEGSFGFSGEAERDVILPDALFATISGLESPGRVGFIIDTPARTAIDAKAPSVVLDRVQDAGNVGSILRSAAGFGFAQVIALEGTASLWSPKVLRAGMGAHFALALIENRQADALAELSLPLIGTSSHAETRLADAGLDAPCAWVFGNEGAGASAAVQARCARVVRIPQPGGEESLNVAAAAAICLYASRREER